MLTSIIVLHCSRRSHCDMRYTMDNRWCESLLSCGKYCNSEYCHEKTIFRRNPVSFDWACKWKCLVYWNQEYDAWLRIRVTADASRKFEASISLSKMMWNQFDDRLDHCVRCIVSRNVSSHYRRMNVSYCGCRVYNRGRDDDRIERKRIEQHDSCRNSQQYQLLCRCRCSSRSHRERSLAGSLLGCRSSLWFSQSPFQSSNQPAMVSGNSSPQREV